MSRHPAVRRVLPVAVAVAVLVLAVGIGRTGALPGWPATGGTTPDRPAPADAASPPAAALDTEAGPGRGAGSPDPGAADVPTGRAALPGAAGSDDDPAGPATPDAPTTTAPAPTTTTTVPAGPQFTLDPYRGLGGWLDVYDWSHTFSRGVDPEGPEAIDHMADLGVGTVFIQASKWDSPTEVLEPERLARFLDRARARGLRTVAWYLPTLVDPEADLRRLLAIAELPIDGLAVDIEALNVNDVAERSRRLVDLSARLRAALPDQVLGGIVLEPVLLEDVNPRMWPGFPWAEIAPHYDVWLPMSYWTNRRSDSGWRDGHRYTAENIDRVRARIGRPDAPVHALGGIGDRTTPEQLAGFRAAAVERAALGASIYDYRTTGDHLWPELAPLTTLAR